MPETCFTIDFLDIAGETELELRQENVSMRVCPKHLSGWMGAFDRLSADIGCRSDAYRASVRERMA
jgi:hypothetical protein